MNDGIAVWVHLVSPGRSRIYVYDISTKKLTKVPNTKGYGWAPSVTPSGTVYFERSGLRCGSNPRIMRYARGATPTTVLQLPSGADMSTTYVSTLSDGSIQVLHERIKCNNPRFGSDIYRFIDDFTLRLSSQSWGRVS
jgi:Tol biopolymer transport system component